MSGPPRECAVRYTLSCGPFGWSWPCWGSLFEGFERRRDGCPDCGGSVDLEVRA